MNWVIKSFPFFVLLLSLVACTQTPSVPMATPTFTPYVGGTLTALASELASPTPWVEGTQMALALPSPIAPQDTLTPLPTFVFPTVTPVGASSPDGTFSPVFYAYKDNASFLLIGGIKKDWGWLSAQDASAYISNEMGYDFYNPKGILQVPGSALEFSPTCRSYFMRSSVASPESMVGVASGWISEQPVSTELSADDPSYLQAVREWFQSQGNSPTDIHITRILQVDLEGDSINEVLLSVSYFKDASGHMTESGDYSVVLMRKVIGDQVLTIPLVKDYYISSVPGGELSYPNTYALLDALDLNQDGTLEVIVAVSRWEGLGAIIYRVDGQNVREVLRTIC